MFQSTQKYSFSLLFSEDVIMVMDTIDRLRKRWTTTLRIKLEIINYFNTSPTFPFDSICKYQQIFDFSDVFKEDQNEILEEIAYFDFANYSFSVTLVPSSTLVELLGA